MHTRNISVSGRSISIETGRLAKQADGAVIVRRRVVVSGREDALDRLDLAPQAPGLLAISQGLSRIYQHDLEMLEHGMVMYDALYSWCKHCQRESHNWPPGS